MPSFKPIHLWAYIDRVRGKSETSESSIEPPKFNSFETNQFERFHEKKIEN